MKIQSRSISTRVMNSLFSVCCLIFIVAITYNHYRLITFETPLDYNEAGMLAVTDTIAAGGNPYAPENTPIRTSIYPPLYNIVVAPLTGLFGNNLVLHRAVNAAFILASCLLCFAMTYRESKSLSGSLAAASIFYAGLLYYSTPIASPNGLGLFLFLASIVLPWLYNFSNRSLFVSIVLGILAFYAKQYFVASLGFIALYLFLAESKIKGFTYGTCSIILFLCVLVIVHETSPQFLANVIFAQGTAQTMGSSSAFLLKQWIDFGQIYLPVFLILGATLLSSVLGTKDKQFSLDTSKYGIWMWNLNDPLLNRRPNYIWYCFLCSVSTITLSLGKNPANHLSYFFQLISPFLLAGTVAIALRAPRMRWLFQILMVAAFYQTYAILQHDFSINNDNWGKIKLELSAADDVYASPIVLAEIMRAGKVFYEDGHTRYLVVADKTPAFLVPEKAEDTPGGLWSSHVSRMRQKLKAQEFQLILLDSWMAMPEDATGGKTTQDLLEKYYYRSGEILLPLAKRPGGGNYRVRIWKPRQISKEW